MQTRKGNVEELIGKLQESNAKNEELIRLRRNLIQNVSHELRTPLTAISGNTELLLNDDNRDSRMRHAKIIKASAGRMASMLNSLLDYFRLDNRKVTILSKPFKPNAIADTLETEFAMQANSKHLTLTVRNHASKVVNRRQEPYFEHRRQPAFQCHQIHGQRHHHADNPMQGRCVYADGGGYGFTASREGRKN